MSAKADKGLDVANGHWRNWNMFRIFGREGYIFTDKKNPRWGIMSSILGLIACASVGTAVYLTFLNKGEALMQYGVVIILAMIYAMAGLVMGIRSLMEKDIFRFFPIVGILLNLLAITASGSIFYLGVI